MNLQVNLPFTPARTRHWSRGSPPTPDDVELDDRYHAGTYGIPDAATLEAMKLAARFQPAINGYSALFH